MCPHDFVWTDFTTAGSSNFDCNNARCWYPLCSPSACCASNCTSFSRCSATLFRSFEVLACCDSAVDFTGKKVVFVVVIFKIEVARDFYVTKQRISTSCGVWRLLGCSGAPPRFDCCPQQSRCLLLNVTKFWNGIKKSQTRLCRQILEQENNKKKSKRIGWKISALGAKGADTFSAKLTFRKQLATTFQYLGTAPSQHRDGFLIT